eukprot:TRINITY_DN35313_c0_g1_i1.p1 TRINITY_DN35313_c0_g1~~TRINITY_DN35313_c0_g1_i1.p1  ORF type:complete len:905 (+),score=241.04 TRINITY_DN35313_c0_g1_i1:67-2781(+)
MSPDATVAAAAADTEAPAQSPAVEAGSEGSAERQDEDPAEVAANSPSSQQQQAQQRPSLAPATRHTTVTDDTVARVCGLSGGELPAWLSHAQVLEFKKAFKEREVAWEHILCKAELQVSTLAKKEVATIAKYRGIIERQAAAAADTEARLQRERQRCAKLLTSSDMLRNTQDMLRRKYDDLCMQTKGSTEPFVEYDGGLSDSVQQILELREENDKLRLSLAHHGVFDTVGRAGLLGSGSRIRSLLQRMRGVLQRVRFQVTLLVGVIPGFMSAGGGFMEQMDEWSRSRGEEEAIADITAHSLAAADTLAGIMGTMAGSLTKARGDTGRAWREDPELKQITQFSTALRAAAKGVSAHAAVVGALSRVGVQRNVPLLGTLRDSVAALGEFMPRLLAAIQQRDKSNVAFGRSACGPAAPREQGPSSPAGHAEESGLSGLDTSTSGVESPAAPSEVQERSSPRARATAAELHRLREENMRLEYDLGTIVERVNRAYRAGLDASEVAAAAVAARRTVPVAPAGCIGSQPVPRTPAAATEQQEPGAGSPPLPRRQSIVRQAAHLTADARAFKATMRELMQSVVNAMSREERSRLIALFDQAVDKARDSAQSSLRALIDELNLKRMLTPSAAPPPKAPSAASAEARTSTANGGLAHADPAAPALPSPQQAVLCAEVRDGLERASSPAALQAHQELRRAAGSPPPLRRCGSAPPAPLAEALAELARDERRHRNGQLQPQQEEVLPSRLAQPRPKPAPVALPSDAASSPQQGSPTAALRARRRSVADSQGASPTQTGKRRVSVRGNSGQPTVGALSPVRVKRDPGGAPSGGAALPRVPSPRSSDGGHSPQRGGATAAGPPRGSVERAPLPALEARAGSPSHRVPTDTPAGPLYGPAPAPALQSKSVLPQLAGGR